MVRFYLLVCFAPAATVYLLVTYPPLTEPPRLGNLGRVLDTC